MESRRFFLVLKKEGNGLLIDRACWDRTSPDLEGGASDSDSLASVCGFWLEMSTRPSSAVGVWRALWWKRVTTSCCCGSGRIGEAISADQSGWSSDALAVTKGGSFIWAAGVEREGQGRRRGIAAAAFHGYRRRRQGWTVPRRRTRGLWRGSTVEIQCRDGLGIGAEERAWRFGTLVTEDSLGGAGLRPL